MQVVKAGKQFVSVTVELQLLIAPFVVAVKLSYPYFCAQSLTRGGLPWSRKYYP